MANELDPELMRQLNEKFAELASITSTIVARSSDSNTATKSNTDALRNNTSAINQQTRSTERSADATKRSTEATDDQSDAIKRANEAINKQSQTVSASQQTFNNLTQATQDQFKAFQASQRAMEEIDRASQLAAQRERDKTLALERAIDASITAVEQFTKAIFDSSKGLSKYSGVVENLTTAASALLFIFGGPLLKVIGLVVGAFGKLFSAQLKNIENTNKLYEQLSEFGAIRLDQFGNGIRSITSDIHAFGLTVENDSGLFTDTMKGLSSEIVALGGTVGEGRGQLANAFKLNIGAPIEDELRRLGYNSQTYFKSWAKATQLAIKSGEAIGKSNADLNRTSNQYLKTLTELSELTGLSRDEQLALREKVLQDEAMYTKRAEIVARGSEAELKRFDALTAVTSKFGDGIGQVIKEVTTAGGIVSERAAEINAFTNGAIERATQAYNRGAIDEQQLRKEIADSVNALRERFGARAIGILGNDFSKQIGLSAEAMQYSATVTKQSADAAKNARNTVDKIAKDGAGAERDLAIKENKMAIANQQALEKIIATTNGPLIGAFDKLINVTNKLREAFVKILRMIGIDAEAGTSAESKRRADEATAELAKVRESYEFQKKQAEKVAKQGAGITGDVKDASQEQRKKYQEIYNKELERTTKFDRERAASLQLQRASALEEERDRLIKEGALKEEVKQNKELIASKQKIADIDKLIEDQEGRRKKVLEALKLTEDDLKGRNYAKNIDAVRQAEQKYLDQLKEQRGRTAADYAAKLEQLVKPGREGIAAATGPTPVSVTPTQIPTDTAKELEGKQKEFYDKMYKSLLDEAKKAGIQNAEVIAKLGATQSALETGYGKSTAGAQNYFGIKAQKGQESATAKTKEWDATQQKYVEVDAKFRKYGSMQESAADYIKFLQENKRYSGVLQAQSIGEAIAQQAKTGYATDPAYEKKLAEIAAKAEKTYATPSTQVATAPQQPEKMFDGGVVTKPTTARLRDGGQDEAVIPLNKLAEMLPIKELIDAINRQSELLVGGFENMTAKLEEGNSIGNDQLLYMQG